MGDVGDEADLAPFGVVEAAELGGWAVIDRETLKIVEPGYLFAEREQAAHWARGELERRRRESAAYRRAQDEVVHRGVATPWSREISSR
ncbi:MAG: hypothetical protein ACRDGD_08665 [Candidatus Limnocylindria bacterium]